MFTVNDLKPGMLVKIADGRYGVCIPIKTGLAIIGKSIYRGSEMCILTSNIRFYSSIYDTGYDIVEVYDVASSNRTDFFLPDSRKCLWRWCEKEMTIEEIEKELGYHIKLVKNH